MKRSLRTSKKTPTEAELNPKQKQEFDKFKNMAKAYEGKNENEIFNDLSQLVQKGKNDGSLNEQKLASMASSIAPLLNGEQKKKLDFLMKNLK